MAIFKGKVLYLRNIDQDQEWGSFVKALLSNSSADKDWTIIFGSEETTTQTVIPYRNTGNNSSDIRTDNGWAINQEESSVDSMGSVAERTRFIPAGNWIFTTPIGYSAPALLDNYDIQARFSIYLVAAGGGTRSLVFSVLSNIVNANLQEGEDTLTASSTQPEITIGVGETIHHSISITSNATTATLGNTTTTVITLQGATSGGLSLTLPGQGIRSRYFKYSDGIGNTYTPVNIFVKKDIEGQGQGVNLFNRLAELYRKLNSNGEGDGEKSLLTVLKTLVANGEAQGNSLLLVKKAVFPAAGLAAGLRLPNNIFKNTTVANGNTDSVFNRTVVFARLFQGDGEGSRSFNKVVIFVRTFTAEGESVIRPRISLDWDDLPKTGTVIQAGQLVYFDWE